MRKIKFLLFAPVLILASCVSYGLIPQASDGVTIKHTRGEQSLIAVRENMAVAVSAQVYNGLIYFNVLVKNFTDKSMYVDDSSAVLTEDNAETGYANPIKVYDAGEYYDKRKSQIVASQVFVAVSTGLSLMNAGRTTTTVHQPYYVSGPGRHRYYRGFGTYTYSTYDPGLAALQTEIAFSNVRNYVNGTNAELDYLRDTLFFPTDIDPKTEYYGLIIAEFGEQVESQMRLDLEFAGTPFTFVFQKAKFE
jgi:hypothetical protein